MMSPFKRIYIDCLQQAPTLFTLIIIIVSQLLNMAAGIDHICPLSL